MVKSLRWRLQVWHALILLAVIAGFGTVLLVQVRRARFDDIDAELIAGARVLEGVLRTMPPAAMDGLLDSEPYPPPPNPPGHRRPPMPGFRGGPGGFGPGGFRPPHFPPPEHHRRVQRALTLPNSLMDRYADEEGAAPYFVIRTDEGDVLAADPDPPSVPLDVDALKWDLERRGRQRGSLREVVLRGPDRTQIIVGRDIGRELGALRGLGWRIGLSGLGLFGIGLLGGWWLSSRAVAPIKIMSDTVAGITADNLSQRVDLRNVDTELGDLATIINHMLERLETSFDQQVRFTADASHELRTPLSIILTQIDLSLGRPRSETEYRDSLGTCRRAAGRMKSLVDDLLMLARADAGKLELRREPIDLALIVEECAELLEPLAQQRKVRLVHGSARASLVGDPDRLARLVMNLATNAIVYNRPGGEVHLRIENIEGDVVLKVLDNGVGIPEADLPLLFERFYRVDKARSRDIGGSGLGLAICRSIVEAHGGTISVLSKLGQGTTFAVRLPRC